MRSEAEIREAIDTLLQTLNRVGLEPKARRQFQAAVAALRWALGDDYQFADVEGTLRECRELLAPVEG